MSEENKKVRDIKLCACGCSELIESFYKGMKSRPRKYKQGHSNRGKKGNQCGNWKGGRKKGSGGYWYIYRPNHQFAMNDGCVAEHRLVYEESHNCCLLSCADIHHIDRDKENNIWYNLTPYSHSIHTKLEMVGNRHSLGYKHTKETKLRMSQSQSVRRKREKLKKDRIGT